MQAGSQFPTICFEMSGQLSTELQRFIAQYIDSVEKLEILLLLARGSDRFWRVEEVYQAIQSSHVSVLRRLRELQKEGLAELNSDGQRFRFQPKSAELGEAVAALATAYQTRRIKVIEAIFNKSDDQLRKFSDAFRFKKEDE